jgi:hypothetical protein
MVCRVSLLRCHRCFCFGAALPTHEARGLLCVHCPRSHCMHQLFRWVCVEFFSAELVSASLMQVCTLACCMVCRYCTALGMMNTIVQVHEQ